MGKRIIQQARGHGGPRYRVRRKAYKYKVEYPSIEGKAVVIKIMNSPAHTAPLAKIKMGNHFFYNPAFNGMVEYQEITIGGNEEKLGNILKLVNIPIGSRVYNLEITPGDGGKLVRVGGASAMIVKKSVGKVGVLMPSKKEIWLNESCRATMGEIAGQGRLDKPIIKAGKMYYMMKAKNKLWPRTSAVKMNVVDHPFGSGRGKRIKSKISKSNAPPGRKVGLLRPRRTGRRKK